MRYASSSTQSLTRLDVDLPQGLMHRNRLTGACSNPLYQSDSCPASSTLGTVSAQLSVRGVTISVPGTIYQLSDPSGGADATFGIVLRPPLSSLGLTSKVYLRDQVSFTNGGGLRHSLVGPLSSVTVLGISLPSRIAQLTLNYNGQANNLALINNPTSCRTQPFTATGTFSDGTSRPRTSSYATTGCQAVPFSPTGDVQIDNPAAGQKTTFAVLLGNGGGESAASIHHGHVVAIGHDFEQVGDFDLKALDAAPSCTDAQAATSPLTCPADSKVFDLSADIEGFGTVTGKAFKTNSPGHKTVGEITLRQGATVRFTGAIGGANLSTLTFSGLPQLPLTALRIKSSSPSLWITNTCTIRTIHMVSDSYSSGHSERVIPAPTPVCPPAVPEITSGPERGITINTSHVEYRFTSPDSGAAFECQKDDGAFFKCASPFIDDWQGEGAHRFSVRAVLGGVAGPVDTATFTIDTMGPVVAFDDAPDADADNDGVADQPFRGQDPTFILAASDATSGLDLEKSSVWFQNTADPTAPAVRGKGPREHVQGHVQVGGAALAPGPTTVTVTLYDFAGHVTVLKLGVIIDGSPPSIAIDEPGVHIAGGPDVEIPIVAADDSLKYDNGEIEIECAREFPDGTAVQGEAVKVITDRDSGRSKGFCRFADVPPGKHKVTVKGWDPVKKEAIASGEFIVDRDPPILNFTSKTDDDNDGDGDADLPFRDQTFSVPFSATDAGSGVKGTACVGKTIDGGGIKGEIASQGDGLVCTFNDVPAGPLTIEISAVDYGGHVTVLKLGVIIDGSPPAIAIDEPGVHITDGNVDVPVTVADDSLRYEKGDVTTECERKGWDGTIKGSYKKTVMDRDHGLSRGLCSFTGVEPGSYKVTVKGWDPVKKEGVAETDLIVDHDPPAPEPPTITVNSPQGQSYARGTSVTVSFTVLGTGVYTYKCLVDNAVVLASCPSPSMFSTAGMAYGAHTFKVIATDEFGNDYSATSSFNVIDSGGTVCIAIYPIPPGCPGYVPPGGGGVITLP